MHNPKNPTSINKPKGTEEATLSCTTKNITLRIIMDNNNIQDQDLSVESTAKELAEVQGGALKYNRSFPYGIINQDIFQNILKPVVLSVKSIVLVTVLLSPPAMAQQQSLTTQVGGLEKHVLSTHSDDLSVRPRLCKDNKGRPKICTCTDRPRLSKASTKPFKTRLTADETSDQKKANPCNPKKGKPVDSQACRDYILGNPKPPIAPKK